MFMDMTDKNQTAGKQLEGRMDKWVDGKEEQQTDDQCEIHWNRSFKKGGMWELRLGDRSSPGSAMK